MSNWPTWQGGSLLDVATWQRVNSIVAVILDTGSGASAFTISIADDFAIVAAQIHPGDTITIADSTGNDGTYTVASLTDNHDFTGTIEITTAVSDSTGDGTLTGSVLPTIADTVEIAHDCTLGDEGAVEYASLLIATGSLITTGTCSITATISITGASVQAHQGVIHVASGALTILGDVDLQVSGIEGIFSDGGALVITGSVACAVDDGALVSINGAIITIHGDATVSAGYGFLWDAGGTIVLNGDLSVSGGIPFQAVGAGGMTIDGRVSGAVQVVPPQAVFPLGNVVLAGTGNFGVGGNITPTFPIGNYTLKSGVVGAGNITLGAVQFPGGANGTVRIPAANATLFGSGNFGPNDTLVPNYYAAPQNKIAAGWHHGIGNATLGTYDPITGQYTDPGRDNVAEGTTYTFAGATITGNFTGNGSGGSTWTELEKAEIRYRLGLDGAVAVPGNAAPATALGPTERNAIADAVLSRSAANVEAYADSHSLCFSVLALGHANTALSPGNLVVYRTDGQTEFARRALRSSPCAARITGIDG